MKEKLLRLINGLALVLLGIGLVIAVPAAINYSRQVLPEAAHSELTAAKLEGLWKHPSYFVKRYFLGGAFVSLSLALHFGSRAHQKRTCPKA